MNKNGNRCPKAIKDNAWQRERIARNLTFGDIAKHFKVSESTVSNWFRGACSPSIDQTAELCRWFTELEPSRPIDYDIGKAEFETMERNFKKVERRTSVLTGKTKKIATTDMEKLRRELDISYEDIVNTARVSMAAVRNWFRGKNVPAGFRCERMKGLFGLTADDIRDRFKADHAEYLKAHEDPNQLKFEPVDIDPETHNLDLKVEDIPVCDQASEEEPKSDWVARAEAEREEIESDWKVLTDAVSYLASRYPLPFRDEVLETFINGTIECIHEGSAVYYGGLSALYTKGGISFDEFMDVYRTLKEGGFVS